MHQLVLVPISDVLLCPIHNVCNLRPRARIQFVRAISPPVSVHFQCTICGVGLDIPEERVVLLNRPGPLVPSWIVQPFDVLLDVLDWPARHHRRYALVSDASGVWRERRSVPTSSQKWGKSLRTLPRPFDMMIPTSSSRSKRFIYPCHQTLNQLSQKERDKPGSTGRGVVGSPCPRSR